MACVCLFLVHACTTMPLCVSLCRKIHSLIHWGSVLSDETAAERFGGHLVALLFSKTKERQLPRLVLCQVGRGDMAGGIASPPSTWLKPTPLRLNRTAISSSDGRLSGLCNVMFKEMCHDFVMAALIRRRLQQLLPHRPFTLHSKWETQELSVF